MPRIRIYALAALLVACLVALIFWPDGEIPMGPGGQEVPVLVIPAQTAEADSMPEAEVLADQRTEVNTAATGDTTSPFLPSYTGPDALTIQVLSADTKLPVADADVYIIDLEVVSQKQVEEAAERWNTGYYQMLRTYGHHYRCNRAGVVSIPRPKDFPIIFAEKGDSAAFFKTSQFSTDELKIYIHNNRTLLVTVLDASGLPTADIPVTSLWEESNFSHTNFTLVTGANGTVVFESLDALLNSGTKNCIHYVELGFPMAKENQTEKQRVELSQTALEQGAITLQLPPTGSVRIAVLDDQGNPHLEPGVVTLHERDPAEGYFKNTRISRPLTEGVADFAYVGLGTELQAVFMAEHANNEDRSTFFGPKTPGERIDVSLNRAGQVVLTGILLSSDGLGLAEESVAFTSVERAIKGQSSKIVESHPTLVQTDSAGRFRYEVPRQSYDGSLSSYTLEIEADVEDVGKIRATLDIPMDWPTGEHDLGKITLSQGRILLSGRVVGPEGAAVSNAFVRLAAAEDIESEQRSWVVIPLLKVRTDAQGEFVILGNPPEALAYQVQIFSPGFEKLELQIELGQQDLELVLFKAAWLSGSIRFGEGVSAQDVVAYLLRDGESDDIDLFGSADPMLATFNFSGKPEVPYTLEIRTKLGETIFRLENITLRSGETTEPPELQPLDLSSSFHTLHLRVENLRGEILDAEVKNKTSLGWFKYRSSQEGLTLVSLTPFEQIHVQAPGYASQLLSNPVGDQVVILDDGWKVYLQIPAEFVHYRGFRMRARAYPARGQEYFSLTNLPDSTDFDASGRAEILLPGPGDYEFSLQALAPDGDLKNLLRLSSVTLSVTDDAQQLDLKVDQAKLDQKIDDRLDQE
jgi:hypothetical protein